MEHPYFVNACLRKGIAWVFHKTLIIGW